MAPKISVFPSYKLKNRLGQCFIATRVYFARVYIFSMVPTKFLAHIPAYFFEFDVYLFFYFFQLRYFKREETYLKRFLFEIVLY